MHPDSRQPETRTAPSSTHQFDWGPYLLKLQVGFCAYSRQRLALALSTLTGNLKPRPISRSGLGLDGASDEHQRNTDIQSASNLRFRRPLSRYI
jgi:hypothetical protein